MKHYKNLGKLQSNALGFISRTYRVYGRHTWQSFDNNITTRLVLLSLWKRGLVEVNFKKNQFRGA